MKQISKEPSNETTNDVKVNWKLKKRNVRKLSKVSKD